jgi:formylglycine-generating enzyme
MRTFALLACLSLSAFLMAANAVAETFGSGVNEFNVEFVTIGNPGNPGDPTVNPSPGGSVPYEFQIGKYEVSRDMVTKANAEGGLGITLADMTSLGGNGPDRPATGVSWNEAARCVNWLNTSEGFPVAYKFSLQPGQIGYNSNANILLWQAGDPGFNAANPFRNSLARYVLPSVHEWHKAAYYDPSTGSYFVYPTGSNTAPTPVISGIAAGTAVYSQSFSRGPADIMSAGGLSPYGTMGQGGNVIEWNETDPDFVNNSLSSLRLERGGNWRTAARTLAGSGLFSDMPISGFDELGFRVASVPEPDSFPLGASTLALVWLSGRIKKSRSPIAS